MNEETITEANLFQPRGIGESESTLTQLVNQAKSNFFTFYFNVLAHICSFLTSPEEAPVIEDETSRLHIVSH